MLLLSDTPSTEIYTDVHTLSLNDALPSWSRYDAVSVPSNEFPAILSGLPRHDDDPALQRPVNRAAVVDLEHAGPLRGIEIAGQPDHPARKSTRLHSSH